MLSSFMFMSLWLSCIISTLLVSFISVVAFSAFSPLIVFFFYMYIFLLFFFFKQKTAYEMRISDWSSDVCSSDLHVAGRKFRRNRPGGLPTRLPRAGQQLGGNAKRHSRGATTVRRRKSRKPDRTSYGQRRFCLHAARAPRLLPADRQRPDRTTQCRNRLDPLHGAQPRLRLQRCLPGPGSHLTSSESRVGKEWVRTV